MGKNGTQTPIYLDYAAATPVNQDVLEAMQPFFVEEFYNPSAGYLAAKQVRKTIETARHTIAKVLGARPAEIVFTAGATEANNLAIHGVMKAFPGSHVVVSAIEHESVLAPAKQYDALVAPVLADGRIDVDSLAKTIQPKTVLVSIMYANNEIGTVQPVHDVAKLIAQIRSERVNAANRTPLYLHVDAAQAPLYLDLHPGRLGIDLMSLNGGKIYGPKQSGALFVRTGVNLQPQVVGGGQEFGLRSGTENVPAIVGFAKALEMAQQQRNDESKRLAECSQYFIDLLKEALPFIQINGSKKHRLPNNVHITISGIDNERIMMELDERGIQCAVGSACSASNDEPSHVLKAIGLTDGEAQASLRFTLGRQTTKEQLAFVVRTMRELIHD